MKLDLLRKLPTATILDSLRPEQPGALKCRPEGTLIDGHHRAKVLRERGIDVNALPREVVPKFPLDGLGDP